MNKLIARQVPPAGLCPRMMMVLSLALAGSMILSWRTAAAAAPSGDLQSACSRFAPAVGNPAISLQVAFNAADQDRPASCAIRGKVVSSPTSTINFRIDLPDPASWNSRLISIGGGGFDGIVPTESPMGLWFARILGPDARQLDSFVMVSSDSGHQGRGEHPIGDFSWVAANPSALRNHAYEANHIVLGLAVEMARQFYGKPPAHRYIIGGSNGGRAGLVAIQRYPDDYDGVVSLEPAISQEGFAANLGPGLFQHVFSDPANWMNGAQIALFERGELDACDSLDGLKDGILSNAAACTYTGSDLLCRMPGQDPDSCLTNGQVETIRRIFMDKKVEVPLADGVVGYPGWGRGAESKDWSSYIFGPSFAARASSDFALADNIVKWGITNDPNASLMTHDPTKWAAQYKALSEEIDATNPDLSAFHQRGGKLIVWYGVSDDCVSYKRTAQYLDSVSAKLGQQRTSQFIRFYLSPAMGHEMAGPGGGSAPLLSALEQWVERGKAPADALEFTLDEQPGRKRATRPLCQYPAYPRYKGSGNPDSAGSFVCATK